MHRLVYAHEIVAIAVEVAERWLRAFPPRSHSGDNGWRRERDKSALARDARRLAMCRASLGSVSSFMQHLKQPIARRANQEDGVSGHFFEQRFYSGALLSDSAVLAAMAYVDLNPVRAKIAQHIEQCHGESESGQGALSALPWTLRHYLDYLQCIIDAEGKTSTHTRADDAQSRWIRQVAALGKRQCAYGDSGLLRDWAAKRNMRRLEIPLP